MAIKPYSDLVKYVLPIATGLPNPVAITFLRESAVEFFSKSLCYRYQQPTLAVTEGVHDYPFDLPSQTEITQLIVVSYDGVELQPITQESLLKMFTKWPEEPSDTPRYFMLLNKETLQLAPTPSEDKLAALRVFAALRPTESSTGVDETILDEFREAIVDGALRRALAVPGKHWTNNELAAFHGKKFIAGIATAKAQTDKGGTRGNVSVRLKGWV